MQGAANTHACILCTIPQSVEVESSHTYSGQAGQTYLRLLHLVLGIHLCDDFVHVGLQDHPTHHHLGQNVVDLRKTGRFNIVKQICFTKYGKSLKTCTRQVVR